MLGMCRRISNSDFCGCLGKSKDISVALGSSSKKSWNIRHVQTIYLLITLVPFDTKSLFVPGFNKSPK